MDLVWKWEELKKKSVGKKRVEMGTTVLNIVNCIPGKEHEGALILRNEAHLHLNKVLHRAFSYVLLLSLNLNSGGGLITLTIDNS